MAVRQKMALFKKRGIHGQKVKILQKWQKKSNGIYSKTKLGVFSLPQEKIGDIDLKPQLAPNRGAQYFWKQSK